MKLPLQSVRPALVNRLYRGAFRSGHGRVKGGWRQAVCRALFYPVEALRLPPWAKLEVDLLVRGRATTLRLDPWNRQLSPLFFSRYADGYETTVARSLASLLPDDGVFLDIGSNWGYFPLLLASRESFRGRVLAFEPVPSTYADLVAVIAQAGLGAWVETRQAAVGGEDGEIAMRVPRHSGLARVDAGGRGARVPMVRLDSLALDRLDVVKVDVEGHELAVFEGARETLLRHRPAIVFENGVGASDRWLPPLAFLESLGYGLHRPEESGGGVVFRPFRAAEREAMDPYFNVVAIA